VTYQAPIDDLLFNIRHLAPWPGDAPEDIDTARAVLEEFARFCADVIAPLNAAGDRAGAQCRDGQVQTPAGFADAYARFVEMGWQSLTHPAAWGGQDLSRAIGAAATEMLNAASMSFALCPLLTEGAIEALRRFGSAEQQATYLPNLVSGRWTGTMNLTEPQAGSDLSLLRTRADRADDGSYRITGTKIFITYGEHDLSGNIVHLVLARTPDAPPGIRGLSLFLVPKVLPQDGRRNAVRCVSIEHKLGVRASPTCVLSFEGATGFLIGAENAGLDCMFVMMNAARFAVGVQGIAIADRALQQAVAYARGRIQGRPVDGSSTGAVAIVRHPDVRRMLGLMRAATEGCRALAAFAAGCLDRCERAGPADARAEALAMAEFLVPVVKGFATEMAVRTTSLGLQVHGGTGFIEATGAAQHYRDARILPIYEGTTAIQANDLLGRKTLRDGGQMVFRLTAMIAATEQAVMACSPRVAKRLANARTAFEAGVRHLIALAPDDPDAAYGGSVPYLMMAGNLLAGWQLARSVLVAERERARGAGSAFLTGKIATAEFYADHILPEVALEADRLTHGARSLGNLAF
jgi:hypothetical protein